jgi:hypothetical protein
MNVSVDSNLLETVLQLANSVLLIPLARFIMRLEHRLTRVETLIERVPKQRDKIDNV